MKPSSLNVLVIDENRIRASVIEDGLRDAGYVQVTIIADMNGLARRITEIDPDVIVIDLYVKLLFQPCNDSHDHHRIELRKAAKERR